MASTKELILIDGSSFLYRAYFAAKKGFSTKSGIPTGAAYIITRMLRSLVNTYSNHSILVVFDAKGPSFRNEMYKEYKATRPPMPEDMKIQIPIIHHLVSAMGMPIVSVQGVEADDVLASYARSAEKLGRKVIICTGDKDLAQLVNDDIVLQDTMKNITYDRAGVIEKFGVPPELIIDLLALKGDTADNIPGMKGVGSVTACAVINAVGGIHKIKDSPDAFKNLSFRGSSTFYQRFIEQWDQIELSYNLAVIKNDLPLPLPIEEIREPHEDHARLSDLFKRLEFTRFAEAQVAEIEGRGGAMQNLVAGAFKPAPVIGLELKDIHEIFGTAAPAASAENAADTNLPLFGALEGARSADPAGQAASETGAPKENDACAARVPADSKCGDYAHRFRIVLTEDELNDLCALLMREKLFSFSVGHTGWYTEGKPVSLSVTLKNGDSFYIPMHHSYLGVPQQLPQQKVMERLKEPFNSPDVLKLAHDLKRHRLALHFAGLEVSGPMCDTMVICHLNDSSQSNDLEVLAVRYSKYTALSYSVDFDRKTPLYELDLDTAMQRCCEQSLMCMLIYTPAVRELEKIFGGDKGKELLDFDMRTLDVIYKMERRGSFLNLEILRELNIGFNASLSDMTAKLSAELGSDCKLSSPRSLGRKLFEDMGIPYPGSDRKNDKSGNRTYSTAENILTQLEDEYPVVRDILRYRFLCKIITTYTEKLPQLISANTGRLHTNFNLAGTVTGRFSSSEPNLQNIPARTAEGKQIRRAFTAPEGYSIVSADYSQIELRLIAHFSQDPNLRKAFINHEDIHRSTAAEVLGKDLSEVTDLERAHAKSTNFGLMYGMSFVGLAKQTGMSRSDARNYIDTYFKRYPTLHAYMSKIKSFAVEHGYVESLTGRHVTIKDIGSTGTRLRQAERAAINAPMQSAAADIIKMAMVAVQKYIDTLPEGSAYMTLQVHDELVFEVKDEILDEFTSKVRAIMESVCTLSVPLEAGISIGDSWGAAH